MITEGLLWLLEGMFLTASSWVGSVPAPPSWITSGISGLDLVFGRLGEFSYWLPVGMLAPAVLAVVGAMTLGLSLRVARIVVSIMTGGGGSAG